MGDLNVSAALGAAIQTVLSGNSTTEFTIDLQFTNTNNNSFGQTPLWVDSMTITQDFANNYCDSLTLSLTASPTDYQALFSNSKELMVSVRLVLIDSQTAQPVFNPAPTVRTYRALLKNPQDLSKKYTTGSLTPTPNMPLTEQHIGTRIPVALSLMEADAYTLRQQQYNGMFTGNTINEVIHHITKSYNVKQLYLVPPDNTMKWDHIVIPPGNNIDTIFDYLHFTYGIYMNGLDWYFSGSTLYIYPGYQNHPTIPHTADIFNAASGTYAGMKSYHTNDLASNNLRIVSTTQVKTTDLSRPAAENIGSGSSFLRSGRLIDKFVTTNANGTFINTNAGLTVGTPVGRTMANAANNPKFSKPTDNIFFESSKLAKWNAMTLECGWKNAVPFLLYPGHSIKYHFDSQGKIQVTQGILENVVYHVTRQRRLGNGNTYSADAILNFRADSDVTDPQNS